MLRYDNLLPKLVPPSITFNFILCKMPFFFDFLVSHGTGQLGSTSGFISAWALLQSGLGLLVSQGGSFAYHLTVTSHWVINLETALKLFQNCPDLDNVAIECILYLWFILKKSVTVKFWHWFLYEWLCQMQCFVFHYITCQIILLASLFWKNEGWLLWCRITNTWNGNSWSIVSIQIECIPITFLLLMNAKRLQ